jgi:cob(I)alamin adenosyltransferase
MGANYIGDMKDREQPEASGIVQSREREFRAEHMARAVCRRVEKSKGERE